MVLVNLTGTFRFHVNFDLKISVPAMVKIHKIRPLAITIWLIGVVTLGLGLYVWGIKSNPLFFMEMLIFGLICIWMTLYSYLWGHQRGHPTRFIAIVVFSSFCVCFYLRSIGILGGHLYFVIPLLFVVILILVQSKTKRQFAEDYKSGIKRNHFNDTKERFEVTKKTTASYPHYLQIILPKRYLDNYDSLKAWLRSIKEHMQK